LLRLAPEVCASLISTLTFAFAMTPPLLSKVRIVKVNLSSPPAFRLLLLCPIDNNSAVGEVTVPPLEFPPEFLSGKYPSLPPPPQQSVYYSSKFPE